MAMSQTVMISLSDDCSSIISTEAVEDSPFLPLLTTVFTVRPPRVPLSRNCAHFSFGQSILEVFILCLAGYILAWQGILDKKTQKVRVCAHGATG